MISAGTYSPLSPAHRIGVVTSSETASRRSRAPRLSKSSKRQVRFGATSRYQLSASAGGSRSYARFAVKSWTRTTCGLPATRTSVSTSQ